MTNLRAGKKKARRHDGSSECSSSSHCPQIAYFDAIALQSGPTALTRLIGLVE
jgi:hypothetical protein